MRMNRPTFKPPERTHEGAKATVGTIHQQLKRSVLACLLWEDTFYESGIEIATRITNLVKQSDPTYVGDLARQARGPYNLRHAPLHLINGLIEAGKTNPEAREGLAELIYDVCQRADEPGELLALYWAGKKRPLSSQLKKGLKMAFEKFGHYQLARYANRESAIKLRDVMFLSHPKPSDLKTAATYKSLANEELKAPKNTWEVALTSCHTDEEKREAWTKLLREDSLGALALIRNLRNMEKCGVHVSTIRAAIKRMDTTRVLPFRFIVAGRHSKMCQFELQDAMFRACEPIEKVNGRTIFLIDISGSMEVRLSAKSEVTRIDAAASLAAVGVELFPDAEVWTFSEHAKRVRLGLRGFELMDAISKNQGHDGTNLADAINCVPPGRLIVITDEQSFTRPTWPRGQRNYLINVAAYRNGISYDPHVVHLDGFSDAVLRWIAEFEKE